MKFYVSWVKHDPEYQQYDPDCALLVSPVWQPKYWTLANFTRLPRSVMLDSGSFYLLRAPDARLTPREVLKRQLTALGDYWDQVDVTICHMDRPVQGSGTKESYDAIEATIANAYELKQLLESPEVHRIRNRVKFLGVIQGCDAQSIRYCAKELVRLGIFQRFGLGSLAPLMDKREIASRVAEALRVVEDLHVFGVSSLATMQLLKQLGVRSFDSSRPIKAAINCTLLYGSPLRCHTIAGTLRHPVISIRRRRPCDCPVCCEYRHELLQTGSKRYNNLRALHNYLMLKQELCGVRSW